MLKSRNRSVFMPRPGKNLQIPLKDVQKQRLEIQQGHK